MTRYPLFALGIWIGKRSKQDKNISFKGWLGGVSLIGGCILLLACDYWFPDNIKWHYGLFFYPYFLIVPSLCFLISIICEYLKNKLKLIIILFENLGKITLELYFVHIFVLDIMNRFFPANMLENKSKLLGLLLSLVLSYGLLYLRQGFAKLIGSCSKKLLWHRQIEEKR